MKNKDPEEKDNLMLAIVFFIAAVLFLGIPLYNFIVSNHP